MTHLRIDEAIVLAGGFGTRLQSVVSDVPKPMALMVGRPFLEHVLDHLADFGVKKAVLSVGYLHDQIVSHFGCRYRDLEVVYSIENEPLGTGGAVQKAFELIDSNECFVLNGDTLFKVDMTAFAAFHRMHGAQISVALKRIDESHRYGSVKLDGVRITSFKEKDSLGGSLINGGVYVVSQDCFKDSDSSAFSFEREILERRTSTIRICGCLFSDYFIDIGIPEDYERAQVDLQKKVALS